jgi:hypothetical protein
MSYPILKQTDPACANIRLGYGTGTVGQYGCLYTALLMMVCRGVTFDNVYYSSFMSCLMQHQNYTVASGNYLASNDISACRPKEWGQAVKVYESVEFPGLPPLMEMNKLFSHVYSGKPALKLIY